MKRILVTGAGGTIGLQVIRFLLSEGKYEITALELKDKHVYKRLKPFRKRINIVYGDVNNEMLMGALVKSHDVVIHLAGVLPPLANVRDDLCKIVDYDGTVTLVNAIRDYHPSCFLLYASSTSLYGKTTKPVTVRTTPSYDTFDYYSKYKFNSEIYIKENLKNYSIFRLAYVLGDPKSESLIYSVSSKSILETVSSEDVGYAFVSAIDFQKEVNKKVFNLSGGEKFRTSYGEYLRHILKNYGLSIRFLSSWLCAEKNYNGHFYQDGDKLDDILHFRSKNLDVYYNTLLKYRTKISRFLPRLLSIPFLIYYKKRSTIEEASKKKEEV